MSHYECKKCLNRYDFCTCTAEDNQKFYEEQNSELPKLSAIEKQVDGTHYNKLKIQPIMLAYQLNATPCFCKLAKYITRDKDDKSVQLEKAKHVIELERELIDGMSLYGQEATGWDCSEVNDVDGKIKAFARQFDNTQIIYRALYAMFHCEHDRAADEVTKLEVIYNG